MVRVVGLAHDRAIERDGRICNQDGRRAMRALQAACVGRLRLCCANAQDIGVRCLAGQLGFERFSVFIGTRQQQLEANAELLQQFLPPGTLRREINKRETGRWHVRDLGMSRAGKPQARSFNAR
jgi:hypothetical protein